MKGCNEKLQIAQNRHVALLMAGIMTLNGVHTAVTMGANVSNNRIIWIKPNMYYYTKQLCAERSFCFADILKKSLSSSAMNLKV